MYAPTTAMQAAPSRGQVYPPCIIFNVLMVRLIGLAMAQLTRKARQLMLRQRQFGCRSLHIFNRHLPPPTPTRLGGSGQLLFDQAKQRWQRWNGNAQVDTVLLQRPADQCILCQLPIVYEHLGQEKGVEVWRKGLTASVSWSHTATGINIKHLGQSSLISEIHLLTLLCRNMTSAGGGTRSAKRRLSIGFSSRFTCTCAPAHSKS